MVRTAQNFRKGIFLTTAVTVWLSYFTLGVFLHLSYSGLIPVKMVAQLNFMVIFAYAGLGLGFGVILGLLAAEKIPANIR